MDQESKYFTLSLESLRSLGSWTADCAERALSVFEKHIHADFRPRAAIEGVRTFAGGEKRTTQLRTLAWMAYTAAREADNPAAAAAAHAASLAAASAFTHPIVDVHQTKHILGPAAYATLALELEHAHDVSIGASTVHWAIAHVPPEVCNMLSKMPARQKGNSRVDILLYELDTSIRSHTLAP
jgi:hypothetical protein